MSLVKQSCYFSLAGWISLTQASGFVLNWNGTDQPLRWELNPAPAAVSVHTNIVNPTTQAVRYYLGRNTYSSSNREQELNAIRSSFDQWQAAPGTLLKFEEGGVMPGQLDANLSDHTNLVFWAKQSTLVNGGLDDISGRLGLTFTAYTAENILTEADITLNGIEFEWFADPLAADVTKVWVEEIALHEIGHFIGLAHSPLGGATMMTRGSRGLSARAGLSQDDILAARFLYPPAGPFSEVGTLAGTVKMNEFNVSGAVVVAENLDGNALAGTVTRSNGVFELPGLPPGVYTIRVGPLDPPTAELALMTGGDISAEFAQVHPKFHPSSSVATVRAGETNLVPVAVRAADRTLFVSRILKAEPAGNFLVDTPLIFVRNQRATVGVYARNLSPAAELLLTGGGVEVTGPPVYRANGPAGLSLISVPIFIMADAAPGLRTLVLRDASAIAYAPGFVEISSIWPDADFDGLDDEFQRRFFSLFTTEEADPGSDPDQDRFSNWQEWSAATNPVNGNSVLKMLELTVAASKVSIQWQSVVGKKYQLWKTSAIGWEWIRLGPSLRALDTVTEFVDEAGSAAVYRVEVLP